jgi:hypothetical protein
MNIKYGRLCGIYNGAHIPMGKATRGTLASLTNTIRKRGRGSRSDSI